MILIVNKMYPPEIGGVEIVAKTIAEVLSEKGCNVTVLTFNKENKLKNERIGNVEVLRVPSILVKDSIRISLAYRKEFKKLASDAQSVVFNFPSGLPELFSSFYKRLNAKKICFYHADIVNRGFLGWCYNNFVVRRFLEIMDVIITTSPNMAESSKYLKDFKGKIKVIPLFVDISHFYPRHSEKRREILSKFSDKAEKIVLYIGRLSWYKGLQYLVSSMKLLDERYVLVIVGEGAMKEKLLDITKKNHLEDRVLFEKHV
ncbi:glycosyltransferase, partial [Pseudothermotoga sp.]|uniref:glycosyltransferase n=1 Tax=Pseudothermotoga sp. TaxID=2033661 RepID=UPI0031F6E428